eukprot:c8477_g1_i2.p1 GENE.c8477_g1_i2~~c8477_g1_i2.p1  ORF type:complete len:325 (+),score=82.11 c8477_g1_i2:49-975(+)
MNNELRGWLVALDNPLRASNNQLRETIGRIFVVVTNENERVYRRALHPQLVHAVIHLLNVPLTPTDVCRVFSILAQMSFWCQTTRNLIGSNSEFFHQGERALSGGSDVVICVLEAMRNTVWQANHAVHQNALEIMPSLLGLLDDQPKNLFVTTLICTIIQNLTLNTETHPHLITLGVPLRLRRILHLSVDLPEGGFLVAGTALANMSEAASAEDMECIRTSGVIDEVLSCFSQTLAKKDYPAGSDVLWDMWEISLGLKNVCRLFHEQLQAKERRTVCSLVKSGLQANMATDPRFVENCLHSLWLTNDV